jgi:hypothetical protein
VLRVTERRVTWQHLGSQNPQPIDCCSRFVEPSQVGITGSQAPIGPRPGRSLLDRHEQLRCRLVEAPEEEECDAQHPEVVADPVPWVETERSLGLLDRKSGLAHPDTESAPQQPSPCEARIKCEGAIDQVDLRTDILAEKGERERRVGEHSRVIAGSFHGLPRSLAALASVRVGIVAPIEEPRPSGADDPSSHSSPRGHATAPVSWTTVLTREPEVWSRGSCTLLDQLIRPLQQRLRDREPKSLGGFEVDYQLELAGLFHW